MQYVRTRDVEMPERAHHNDSGIDFFVPNGGSFLLRTNQRATIQLGVKTILPEGYDLMFVDKSGLASKQGLTILGGLIDNGYRGELAVVVYNSGQEPINLVGGQKIVQGVLRSVSYSQPEEISEDEYIADTILEEEKGRGEGGFGSSGNGVEKPTLEEAYKLHNKKEWKKL